MTRPRGFALPTVLAALLLMAMVVAAGAQRALLLSRQATIDLARAELAAALSEAEASALWEGADSTRFAAASPGGLVASGSLQVGRARAVWRVLGAAPPYATIEIEAQAPVFGGAVHARSRGVAAWASDSARGPHWALEGGFGPVRMPAQ